MITELIIRQATVADAAEVARLLGELGYDASAEDVQNRWSKQAEAGAFILVAEGQGRLLGLLSFAQMPLLHADGYLGRVTGLVVDAEWRGRGLGKRLLRAMEALAWEQDCLRVEITSGDFRPDAHAFYEHVGYAPDERRFVRRRPSA